MDYFFNQIPRPSSATIFIENIRHNYLKIQEHTKKKIMCVVKANAYGHGIVEVAKSLQKLNPHSFGVALVQEGALLRKNGIVKPILVFGGFEKNQIPYHFQYNLDFTISSIEKLHQVEEYALHHKKVAHIHLKIDTGMGRIGVRPSSSAILIEACLAAQDKGAVVIDGIYSHFAASEVKNDPYNQKQLDAFLQACQHFTNLGFLPPLRHMANSGAIIQMKESHLDLVRPGLMLYGVSPIKEDLHPLDIRPALKLTSTTVYFKAVLPGESISYNHTWTAKEQERIVTIPVGYADGIPFSYASNGQVLIHGQRYPIVGRICMDQFMANLGKKGEAYNGDEVVLIGKQEGPHGVDEITAQEIATNSGTSVYEILVRLSERIPRIYKS